MSLVATPEQASRTARLEATFGPQRRASRRPGITDAIMALFNGDGSPGMRELQGEPEVIEPDMMPEPHSVSAPVTSPDGPSTAVAASEAPRLSAPVEEPGMGKGRHGILGTIADVFAPRPGTFWHSALNNGLVNALQGQQEYRQGQRAQATTQATADAKLRSLLANGEYTVVGNNVLHRPADGSTPSFVKVPQNEGETERLIDKWNQAKEAGDLGLAGMYERAIKGYQYSPEVITRQGEARTRTVVEGKKAQRFAPRAAPANKPPAGFVLDGN